MLNRRSAGTLVQRNITAMSDPTKLQPATKDARLRITRVQVQDGRIRLRRLDRLDLLMQGVRQVSPFKIDQRERA